MFYRFPEITDVSDLLTAIQGRDEFIVKRDEEHGYGVINYMVNFEDTFPPVDGCDEEEIRRRSLLRECRGIKFDLQTNSILTRTYHKFFNINERPETLSTEVDFSQPHMILEKLDGSMITPLAVGSEIRWCTKMGLTEVAKPVDQWVALHPNYKDLAKHAIDCGFTVIFEWCSRKQRIVIDYPTDRLVLTAARDNITGDYCSYKELTRIAERFDIDLVRALPGSIDNIEQFMKEAHDLEGAEGYIIRFNNGHMLKVKGAWYCQLHKTLDQLRFEKDVIRLILNEQLDDAKPFLPPELAKCADQFAKDIYANIAHLADSIYWKTQTEFDNLNGSKKKFAEEILSKPKNKILSRQYFMMWDHLEKGASFMEQTLISQVKDATSSQTNVDNARHLIGGIRWTQYIESSSDE